MKHLFVAGMSSVISAVVFASQPPVSQQRGEFFFDEIEQLKGGPGWFLQAHVDRQAWPAEVDDAFLAEMAAGAWNAYQDVKFRGTPRGRRGVWQTVGPVHEQTDEPFFWESTSGRVTDMAMGPDCSQGHCTLYVGTAGGGLWKTTKALHANNPKWKYLSNGLLSNNIGSVNLDPNDPSGNTLYIGTGETNFTFTSMAGKGLFRSTDGGASFTRIETMITDVAVDPNPIDFTATRGISRVAVKPGDPNTIYVGTATASQGMTGVRGGQSTLTGGPQARLGLYGTTDGGATWSKLFEVPENTNSGAGTHEGIWELISGVKDVQIDPLDPSHVWISVADDGIYRSAPSLEGGDDTFRKVFNIIGYTQDDSYAAFDLTVKDGKTRAYVYNGNGIDRFQQGLFRLDDAAVPALALFDGLSNTASWLALSVGAPENQVSWVVCGGQCVYDLEVATPDGYPDRVLLGGQLQAWTGDPTIYSLDAGVTFKSLAVDNQDPPRVPHVDVRAITFSPDNPDIVFVGSDGGVVRTSGEYADVTQHCAELFSPGSFGETLCYESWDRVPEKLVFMNRGLQSMQLYNISADPNDPLKRIMAGTQDNSTQWTDGTRSVQNWTQILSVGDGTSANGFHREDPNILFASFQSSYFFTNFVAEPGSENWLHTGGPMTFSGETLYPNDAPGSGRQFITFDPLDADTQFTGYEHVWRTTNNGGERATLEANDCSLAGNWFQEICGDWEPLGEFLTRDQFGVDRQGGVISAAERSAGDSGTLWAATTLGRVFVTHNADAAAAAVTFNRVDNASTPPRFISGIAPDPDNPNRAWVSYSGFNGVTPAEPGHVFEVIYDPGTMTATWTNIDHNLGDMPINHIVLDDVTGDLYAATDFGVIVLVSGEDSWKMAGTGLPSVLTPHLEIHPQHRMLFAATHGLGGWYLNLPRR